MTEESRAFKQERNETRVISTMRASLPPQGPLSSSQETNLLNTLLMACQKGVKKEEGRRMVGKKGVCSYVRNHTSPCKRCHTLAFLTSN